MDTLLTTEGPITEGALTAETQDHWRSEALNEALRAEAYGDNSEDALLREVRRIRPGGATLMMYLDRVQLRCFLDKESGPVHSLTPGSDGFLGQNSDGEVIPYVGWLGAQWQGQALEVALVPCAARIGYVLFLGDSEALLADFARIMAAFVERPAAACATRTAGRMRRTWMPKSAK